MLLNQSFYEKVYPAGTAAKKDYNIYLLNMKRPLSPYSHDYSASFLQPDTSRSDYFSYIEKQENLNRMWGRFLPYMISDENNDRALQRYESTVQNMKNNELDFVVGFMKDSYVRAKAALNVEKGWPAYQPGYESPVTGPNGDFSFWQDAVKQ
jgi:hypothetical protein